MSFIPGMPFVGGASSSSYRINQSLRFRAANSAHLTRTTVSSPTNDKIFTLSWWVKRGAFSTSSPMTMFGGTSGTADNISFGTLLSGTAGDQIGIRDNDVGNYLVQSSNLYRDPSGWMHFVVTVDTTQATATNRVRIYKDNVEVSYTGTTYPSQNYVFDWNRASRNVAIGRRRFDDAQWYFDGYLADVIQVDGQALTPSSFGKADSVTGAWVPKKYAGTYGANGFYLPFNDATSTTTISQDRSGNGNNWTSSGISVTSGVTFDQMLDSPTNSYATLSPIRANAGTLTAANLDIPVVGSSISNAATWTLTSGKWYFEVTSGTASGGYPIIGAYDASGAASFSSGPGQSGGTNGVSYWSNGTRAFNWTSTVSWGATFASGDVIGVAIDADTGKIWFSKNGTWQASGDPAAGTSPAGTMASGQYTPGAVAQVGSASSFNFGQRPFAYTPPTGFVALNTKNLPTPTLPNGAVAFQATLRTSTGATASVTSLAFQPDLVWIKSRSNATNHNLFDAVRGVNNGLVSNSTAAEYADANSLTAFNSNGYSLGSDGSSRGTNINTNTYVDWSWREGAAYGFDIVTYTGTGVARTVAHGLNAVPHMMIVKDRTTGVNNWPVYHRNAAASPATVHLRLNQTSANVTTSGIWNDTAPTSSVFSVGTDGATNGNTNNFVAYLWTEIPGFSRFGAYTGNGSADGPFVWCGFKPRWLLVKSTSVDNWWVVDAARSPPNVVSAYVLTNVSNAEASVAVIDFTANGFKARNSASLNTGTDTYIFAAFAETAFKFSNAR
jgi:hypothetical protein